MYPNSNFWPATRESPTSALTRARMAFFVDTWVGKVNTYMYQIMKAEGEEKEKLGTDLVEAVRKEIEPLLEDAGPFFGGSRSITLAEVCDWFCCQNVEGLESQTANIHPGFNSTIRGPIQSICRHRFDAEEHVEGT